MNERTIRDGFTGAALLVVLSLSGCGGSTIPPSTASTQASSSVRTHAATAALAQATAKFSRCIARSPHRRLSTSGRLSIDGTSESIVDLRHIVANVSLYGSHAEAQANARVMTGYADRVVRGVYLVAIDRHVRHRDAVEIRRCAAHITASTPATAAGAAGTAAALWYTRPATCADPHMQTLTNGGDDPGLDTYFAHRFGPPPGQAVHGWRWSTELSSDCSNPNAPPDETLSQFAGLDAKQHTYYVGTGNTGATGAGNSLVP